MIKQCTRNVATLFLASLLSVASYFHRSAQAEELKVADYAPPVNVVAPLSGEGLLWAPALRPTAYKQIAFKFGYSYHSFDYSGEDIDGSAYLLFLSGEYYFMDKLTLGVDIPFLVGYDVSSESELVEDSGVDFGNIRLHVRYPVLERAESGIVITPAFRIWLPTNTFLTIEDVPFVGELDIIENFAVFEPMLLFAVDIDPLSFVFDTGPKFFAVNDQDDFSFWSFNFIAGAAPISSMQDLEFVLELNMLVELDEDDAPSAGSVDRVLPVALSIGARYRFEPFFAELALRFGLNEAEFYFGDVNVGILFGYVPNL